MENSDIKDLNVEIIIVGVKYRKGDRVIVNNRKKAIVYNSIVKTTFAGDRYINNVSYLVDLTDDKWITRREGSKEVFGGPSSCTVDESELERFVN